MEFVTHSREETEALGARLADALAEGRVVVKLQEEYTPKSDFEIAYEDRR